jgi:beta-phosphoglucomutase
MHVLIPLGGRGERFAREGYTTPKPLIRVAQQPMLQYLLERLRRLRDTFPAVEVSIVYHTWLEPHGWSTWLSTHFPWVHTIPIRVDTRGAAETVHLGLQALGSRLSADTPIALMDGDAFYVDEVMHRVYAARAQHTLVYFEQDPTDPASNYSYLKLDPDTQQVRAIYEKERVSASANTGIYLFARAACLRAHVAQVVEQDLRIHGEMYTSAVIQLLLAAGEQVQGLRIPASHMFCLGVPRLVRHFEDALHAFLFDLDGTLVDTDGIYEMVWTQLLHEFDYPVTANTFAEAIAGRNDASVLSALFPHMSLAERQQVSSRKDELFQRHLSSVRAFPGAVAFIHQLRARTPHKIGLVTNCNRSTAESILKILGIWDVLDTVVIGNECPRPKPYSDPYEIALRNVGVPHSRAIIFEDSPSGLLSAQGVFPKCLVQVLGPAPLSEAAQRHLTDFVALTPEEFLYEETTVDHTLKRVYTLLHDHFPDAKQIRVHTRKLKGGFIADVLAVDVVTASGTRLDCVLKLQNHESTSKLAQMATALGLYEREYYFYEHLRSDLPVHAPRCHGILRDEDGTPQAILLEYLRTPEYTLNLDLNQVHRRETECIVERMAQLHAHFIPLAPHFPGLRKTNDPLFCPAWGEFVAAHWPAFREKWAGTLTPAQLAHGDKLVTQFPQAQHALSQGPGLTLIHGDIKSANIFYRTPAEAGAPHEPYFIDWQYIAMGKGVQDLVFFLVESFEPLTLAQYGSFLRDAYYEAFTRELPFEYSRDTYQADFVHALGYYPFFVAVWFGTLNTEDLIDADFPRVYVQRLFHALDLFAA